MDFLISIGLFSAKAVVVLIIVLLALIGILAVAAKGKKSGAEAQKLKIKHLNALQDEEHQRLLTEIDEKAAKQAAKKKKAAKEKEHDKARVFVLNFEGDMRCQAVSELRRHISAVIRLARKEKDQVLLTIKSGGGVVNGYGLAASQCARLRDAGIPLTVAIDEVAASGGYLMAATASTIIAAPFAIIGSIGVVMQLPNFNRWLKKHNIEFEQITAGEHKRTLTLLGENTDKARKKCQEEANETHTLFKEFVQQARPNLDMDKVATGEHWYGTQALTLGLVDTLQTSDDYLSKMADTHALYHITSHKKKTLKERLANQANLFFQELKQLCMGVSS